ncbi:hypothetical protein MGSAQ_002910 [marine sediment metagenome]|uniref:Uncharacterized protein n=1 Tax=marine sediment metagenome TaxID=412755 RepID=A0A1B6NQ91_9ZZZZ
MAVRSMPCCGAAPSVTATTGFEAASRPGFTAGSAR